MEIKKDILWRVYLVYIFICLFAIFIIVKVTKIQFSEGDFWREKAKSLTTQYINIEAVRGNIFAADGSLLATSLPFYEVGMDVNTDYLTDELFRQNSDSLAFCLSKLFGDKSKKEYYKMLNDARRSNERYLLIF